jgi:type I restriction enzyme, R subunit
MGMLPEELARKEIDEQLIECGWVLQLGFDKELNPYSELINRNFKNWIFGKNAGNIQYTTEQTEWLRMIKDHIIASVNVERADFDNTPFAENGGLIRFEQLFGKQIDTLLEELNLELVA